MATEWIIVTTDGYDPEEVDNPRSVTDTCPACERRVRLCERQLVKNLRLFSLPLLAVEQGARVFQCPHCEACFEPPVEEPAATHTVGPDTLTDPDGRTARPGPTVPTPDPTRLKELEDSLTRADDEVSLWKLRVELATRKGAADLAEEARGMVDRYTRVTDGLRAELSRLRGAPATASRAEHVPGAVPAETASEAPSRVPVEALETPVMPRLPEVPEKAPEPTPAQVDDEMAALKRKLRKRD